MKIVSQGEDVSGTVVLDMISNSVDKFKLIEESDSRGPGNLAAQQPSSTQVKDSKVEDNPSKYDLWKARVDALNEFSIPNPNSTEMFTGHIEFLESVKKYISLNGGPGLTPSG